MRKLRCGMTFCGETFAAELTLPDNYFDALGRPLMHLLNSRLGAQPTITWRPDWQCEPVETKTELPPIGEELQKLREVVASLEQKFNG